MPRRKSTTEEESDNPSFEDGLAGLEAIIEAMEHEQLPLEELVAYYENGSALLDRCESMLQSARGRIELITLRQKTAIEPAAEPAAPAFTSPSGPPDSSDADDIRLF